MKTITTVLLVTTAVVVSMSRPSAGAFEPGFCSLGLYGVIEKVVFEPNDTAPDRIQVWGTFAYVDGCEEQPIPGENARVTNTGVAEVDDDAERVRGVSTTAYGSLYFRLPEVWVWGAREVSSTEYRYVYFKKFTDGRPMNAQPAATTSNIDVVRREWTDLAAKAGTEQAVGFGRWPYSGDFAALRPDASSSGASHHILEFVPGPGGIIQTDLRVRSASEAPAAPAAYHTSKGIVARNDGESLAAVVARITESLNRLFMDEVDRDKARALYPATTKH